MAKITEAKFLTPLEDRMAAGVDNGVWTLTNPLIYQSVVAQKVITVPTGFVTDYASVPRIAPIAYALCGGTSVEASVVHDFLYTSHIVDREMADAVLREASAASGVPAWRRNIMWLGVRLFGGTHWDPKPAAPTT